MYLTWLIVVIGMTYNAYMVGKLAGTYLHIRNLRKDLRN